MSDFNLQFISRSDVVKLRGGEVRLGEKMIFRDESDSWKREGFHILGVCEDIGPRLNGGLGGAQNAFLPFIERLVSVQSNKFLDGGDIVIHGFLKWNEASVPSNVLIEELDDIVASWVRSVKENQGIPIVIGGGHNNAFGLIKGVSEFLGEGIAAVNCDPHADTRAIESRHSGNPFSFAIARNYLKNYTVLGLHESYNNTFILDYLAEHQIAHTFFEHWLDEPESFYSDIDATAKKHQHIGCGLELDMDAIAGMPSSAFTPSGLSMEQARFYIRKMASRVPIHYLHLPEAAPQSDMENKIVGKSLAYLVVDFIKCQSNLRKLISS
jgi:formiminoglutamase